MNPPAIEALVRVEVVPYDPAWPSRFAAERASLTTAVGSFFTDLEHIGSTSVPGLRAKPIIDMMAAVATLSESGPLVSALQPLGYKLIETGMRNRLFLRKSNAEGQVFQLHVVEQATWPERKERLMRDHLIAHPDEALAYGELKDQLAKQFADESLTYTKAKTDFIQGMVDRARAERGLASVDVWND